MRIIFETEDAYDYAIREAKEAAWDEGAKWVVGEFLTTDTEDAAGFLAPADNPYREEADRG